MTALPRVGFLGVGWIGPHRMETLLVGGSATVAAIADPDSARIAEASVLCPGIPQGEGASMLLECDLDGIVIATPSAFHAEQCLAFLERGVAVFCQKPLGRTARETSSIVAS